MACPDGDSEGYADEMYNNGMIGCFGAYAVRPDSRIRDFGKTCHAAGIRRWADSGKTRLIKPKISKSFSFVEKTEEKSRDLVPMNFGYF